MTKPKCPKCNSEKCYGISRVVGYFSRISNWNNSKQGELKARQKGDYDITKVKNEDINKHNN